MMEMKRTDNFSELPIKKIHLDTTACIFEQTDVLSCKSSSFSGWDTSQMSQTIFGAETEEHYFLQKFSQGEYSSCLGVDFLNGESLPSRRIPGLRDKIIEKIRSKGNIPPLGFLYKLDKSKILSLEQFIKSIICSKEVFLDEWKKEPDLMVLVSWMERLVLSNSHLISPILEWILQDSTVKTGWTVNFFESFNDRGILERDDLKKFYGKVITSLITSNPNTQILKALEEQSTWSEAIINTSKESFWRNVYIEIIIPFECLGEIIRLYKRILRRKEVNWFHCLSLLSLIHSYDRSNVSKEVNELVSFFLSAGFDDQNTEYMTIAFLLIRQIHFPDMTSNYARWFESTFTIPTSKTKASRSNYEFFLKFLSSLVPQEKSTYLKTHISKHPLPPNPNLKVLYGDYICLARTKLADIIDEKKKEEENLIFSEIPSEILLEVDSDINAAIESLKSTGKVPQKILQASIFKKQYFNSYFLNRLLVTMSKTEDTISLVQALAKKGKISKNMLSLFQKR